MGNRPTESARAPLPDLAQYSAEPILRPDNGKPQGVAELLYSE